MFDLKKDRQLLQQLSKQLLVAIAYSLLSQLVLSFFSDNGVVTMVYPPIGLALATLLIGGKCYLWSVLLGSFLSNASIGLPWLCAAVIGTGSTMATFCGSWLLTRNGKFDAGLRHLPDYLRLLFWGGVVSCGIPAVVGSTSLLFFEIIDTDKYVANIRHWWMGDALGVVLMTPLLLVFWESKSVRINLATAIESLLLIGASTLTGQVVFIDWFHNSIGQVARGYWMFLFITWIAVRLGTRGVVTALAITATQALVGVANHLGFFADDMAKTNLANYWFYMVILALVGMALAIYVGERTQAEQELKKYRLHLEKLVEERTAQLLKAKQAAETANIAKSTFIATMSHELRTPLNAILGFSELMSRDNAASPAQKETLAIINRSGAHLLSMINDVLDISKIEAGRLEVDIETFDLIHLLQDISDIVGVNAAHNQLSFRLEIAPDIPQYVKTDTGKLRQILINLLGNAVKFTQQGGVILRANCHAVATPGMVMLNIEVADSGMGMPKDRLADLFQPFVQLPQANLDTKGTGLGLVISKSLVELMGGYITVSSVLGVGSTFKIDLPVAIATTDDISVDEDWNPVKSLAPHQPKWRLLVVDDNPDNRLLLFKILTEVGFQVREAINGEEAISVFQQWQPHLIWMDMRMPVMDGYQATAKIRQLKDGNRVKIIAITASAFIEEHQKIIDAGCDAVLHKPFHAPELFAALMSCLKVKFIYRDIPGVEASPKQEISQTTLSLIPVELRQQLHQTALNLDMEGTDAVIEQIRAIAPEVANGLQDLAQAYQFDQIIQFTETVAS